ncbi:hypothetical protein QQF64_005635 [Cirrhinus molitorella]|uniref:Uncharacterized protein n=1 Tax=Cirrhinus molitorella TaxID=172907 RepID=A0ABR3MCV6_9TELE
MEYRMGSCIGVARSQVTPHLSRCRQNGKMRMGGKTSPAVRWLSVQAEEGDEGEYWCWTGLTSGGYERKSMYFWLSFLVLACSGRRLGDEERERRWEWKGKKEGEVQKDA